jgi:hypothetical protein
MLVFPQQFGDVASRILDVTEMEGIGDAGIDAGRGGPWVNSWSQGLFPAVVYPVRAEGAFLGNPDAPVLHARSLVWSWLAPIRIGGTVHLVKRLVWAGEKAVTTADAKIVIDDDDAIIALPYRARRTHLHAGGITAMHASNRHEGSAYVGILARFHIQHLTPLHLR